MTHGQAMGWSWRRLRRGMAAGAVRLAAGLALGVALCGPAAGGARAAEPPIVLPRNLQERDVIFDADGLKGATVVSGTWELQAAGDGCVAPLQWLVQTAVANDYNVIVLPGAPLAEVDISVRFKPISGREDASGGIVFRFDQGRYYLVRANALEDNFRLYSVDGRRRELASARVPPPALGRWHTIRVVAKGDHVQAYLNDKLLLDHHDAKFGAGGVGLWTKADSVTAFDGLSIRGTPAPGVQHGQ